ncbi:MAG: hypothetical protein ACXWLH_03770 [Candidatus Saccharimonadales bacterium]
MAVDKSKRKTIDKILISLGVVATVVLFVAGGLAWWAYSFTSHNVRNELAAQKIYFPADGSPGLTALPAADQAKVAPYAGQQVLDGRQAKVFANNYIAVHLSEVANGQTYAEVSAQALKDPTNTKLQGQANTLFKGETLRGLLLGDAYAFWTVGYIAQLTALIFFAAGGIMGILVILGLGHLALINKR